MKMEEGGVMMLAKPVIPRPKIKVQPRNPGEGFIQGGLNSATPSPILFMSSLHGDSDPYTDSKPFQSLVAEAFASPTFSPTAFFNSPVNRNMVADTAISNGDEKPSQAESSEMGKANADSHSISSAKYKALMPSRLPITSSSPHITLSPGISPATLLESPIFFSMSQVDPSPTTGTFSILPPVHGGNDGSVDDDRVKSPERNDNFIFKPLLPSEENNGSPAYINVGGDRPWKPHMGSNVLHGDVVGAFDSTCKQASSFSSGAMEPEDNIELMGVASAAPMPLITKLSNGRLSTDGYNWKKYGQKTLKNSENPRSYYRCTHPNCLAKKHVECSPDEAEITEIIYKGKHNHPKPDGTRKRAKNGSSVPQNSAGGFHDRIVQDSVTASKMNHEKTSVDLSVSYVHSHGGLSGTREFSFTSPSNEDDENGEASTAGDGGDDEPHSKHRRIENQEGFSRESVRTAREPRVVVQTVSEKDILDDGYRWRKYGQKVVKGHRHPRNYYKCTNIGCKVRKHVERSSSDSKCVMTTYEGKHNHCVPPPRGNIQEPEEEATAPAVSYPASQAHIYSEGAYGFGV